MQQGIYINQCCNAAWLVFQFRAQGSKKGLASSSPTSPRREASLLDLPGHAPGNFFMVRSAWVRPCGDKSHPEMVTASEAKRQLRKGDRLWGGSAERSCGPMNKNRI